MKLHLFQSKEQIEDRVEIYYKEMTPVIQKVIDVIHDDYPVLKSKEDVYPLEETLSHYEVLLSDYGFTRISKSNIVNVYQIKAMKSEINMRICATFENKEKIYINRSYKKNFMDYLVNMRGCTNEK